jgi:hypothetical protein
MTTYDTFGARRFGRMATVAAGTAAAALAVAGLAGAMPAGASRNPAFLAGQTLVVNGTSANDSLALRLATGDPATLQVDFGDDGVADASFARDAFTAIRVNLRAGDDTVRIDQVNGAFADEAITVVGGSGDDVFNGGDGAEHFVGGSGDDQNDGNRGDDTADLGSGQDAFRWDPGDGSDTIEGRSGTDTLDFNGAGADEKMELVPNGSRALFLRDVANIRMDMDGVEQLDLTALGGIDTMTVADMTGTDFTHASVDLSGPAGGPDGAADTVTVVGTNAPDVVSVAAPGAVEVSGLQTQVSIPGSETLDTLRITTLAGNDEVSVDPGVAALIGVVVDLGADEV